MPEMIGIYDMDPSPPPGIAPLDARAIAVTMMAPSAPSAAPEAPVEENDEDIAESAAAEAAAEGGLASTTRRAATRPERRCSLHDEA